MFRANSVLSTVVVLSLSALIGGCSTPAHAEKAPPPQLVVTSVASDFDAAPCLMTLRGREFGDDQLDLRLGEEALLLVDHGDTWAIAEFDCATEPGDYLLAVWRGPSNTDRDVLSLTIGAVGPEGPTGPEGPAGAQGPEGSPGPAGVAGLEIRVFQMLRPMERNDLYSYDCPSGKHVLSGGYRGLPGTSLEATGFRITGSYPADEDTWSFKIGGDPPTGGRDELGEFFLVCASTN